jgi:hypothetical protein
LAIIDPTEFYQLVGEHVAPYGYKPYGGKSRLTFRKDIQTGWIGLSFRIIERYEWISTSFHYYNAQIFEISRHSLSVEVGRFDAWFIAGNQLYLPDVYHIWNINMDKRKSVKWHVEKVLANFPRSSVFYEKFCCDHDLIFHHLSTNSHFSTQLLNMANGRLCQAIALACFMERKSTIVDIMENYRNTLTVEEGRDQILNQAVGYIQRLASLNILDQEIAADCLRFRVALP